MREVTEVLMPIYLQPCKWNVSEYLSFSFTYVFYSYVFRYNMHFIAWLILINGTFTNVNKQKLKKLLCFGTCLFLLCSEPWNHYYVKKPKLACWKVRGRYGEEIRCSGQQPAHRQTHEWSHPGSSSHHLACQLTADALVSPEEIAQLT